MAIIACDTSHPEKVSTVFLKFAQPYLNIAFEDHKDVTCAELNRVMKTPWVIWNAHYMDQQGSERNYSECPLT